MNCLCEIIEVGTIFSKLQSVVIDQQGKATSRRFVHIISQFKAKQYVLKNIQNLHISSFLPFFGHAEILSVKGCDGFLIGSRFLHIDRNIQLKKITLTTNNATEFFESCRFLCRINWSTIIKLECENIQYDGDVDDVSFIFTCNITTLFRLIVLYKICFKNFLLLLLFILDMQFYCTNI